MFATLLRTVLLLSFVNLGTGVKWADCNFGASSPTEPGTFLSWDEACATEGCPTYEEWSDLVEKCTWKMETIDGRNGIRVTGRNGKSIFLPACGYFSGSLVSDNNWGYYWSNTQSEFAPDEGLGNCFTSKGAYRWYSGPKTMHFPLRQVQRTKK